MKQTFGQFLDQWLRDYAWPNLSAETAQAYDIMARKHLIPTLGSIPLQQLTPARLQAYYTEKLTSGRRDGKGGLSPHTVRHHHRLIHAVMPGAAKCVSKMVSKNRSQRIGVCTLTNLVTEVDPNVEPKRGRRRRLAGTA